MVELALADAQEASFPDEAAELHAGDQEGDGFAEDEVIGYLRRSGGAVVGRGGRGRRIFAAAVKSLLEVVGDEVRAFEEEIDVICRRAFHAVGRGDPCCVLGG